MTPDDPRHGTYAGVKAHARSDEALCEPCQQANYLYTKRMRVRLAKGQRNRIRLGEAAWQILDTYSATQLAEPTGLNRNMLYRLKADGPDRIVNRSTRDAILTARLPWTVIGVQRRVQALYALGWSGRAIGAQVGTGHDAVLRLLDRDASFVRHQYAERIVEAYERLCMTAPPRSRESARARNRAAANGWRPPLAWDDIDLDDEPDAAPVRQSYRPAELVAEFEWLMQAGIGHEEALDRLGVTWGAIEKARKRMSEREAA